MTIATFAPVCQSAGIPQAPDADAPRHMQRLRSRDASDHLAMYQAGFYVTSDRQSGAFYWDRRDERHIVPLEPATGWTTDRPHAD